MAGVEWVSVVSSAALAEAAASALTLLASPRSVAIILAWRSTRHLSAPPTFRKRSVKALPDAFGESMPN